MKVKIWISALLAAVLAQPALGCDLCAVYSASQAQGEIGKGAFAGGAEQFTHFGTVQMDGREMPNPSGQYLDSSVSQVFAGYNFSERLGVQVNLPVIYRSFERPDGAGGIDRGTESGISDVSLLATAVPFRTRRKDFSLNWMLLGGIKFPTGSTQRLKEELNEVEDPIGPPSGIHGHDLTLGSGSYDGIVGSSLYTRSHKWFFSAGMQYAVRSTGDFEYRFANDLTWAGGPGYVVLLQDEFSFSLQAIVSGEHKGKDRFKGATVEDTGVTSVYLGPQVNLTWREHLAAYLAADLPASIYNTSLQAVPDYRVRAGLTWRF